MGLWHFLWQIVWTGRRHHRYTFDAISVSSISTKVFTHCKQSKYTIVSNLFNGRIRFVSLPHKLQLGKGAEILGGHTQNHTHTHTFAQKTRPLYIRTNTHTHTQNRQTHSVVAAGPWSRCRWRVGCGILTRAAERVPNGSKVK